MDSFLGFIRSQRAARFTTAEAKMNIQKSFYVAVRQVVSDFGSYLTEKQKSAIAYEGEKKPSERQEGSGAHKEQQHCLEATCKKLNKHTLLSGVLCLAAMNTILNVYWYK